MRRRDLLAIAALPGAIAAGCSVETRIVDGADAPSYAPPDPARPAPRLALVLAAGGPRGFAHVGVLRALAELGVRPDLVVGASIGALLGAALAAGLPTERIAALAFDFDFHSMLRWSPSTGAKLEGGAIATLLDDALGVRRFEQLPTPLAVVATHVADGRPVVFNRGLIAPAVQASCAIPGWFAPVRIGGRDLVDGDLSSPLPVRTARALGARRVVAVDVAVHADRPRPSGAERWVDSDRAKRAQIDAEARLADLVLHPYFGYWVSVKREFRERAARAAYEHTMAQAAALRALAGAAAAGA